MKIADSSVVMSSVRAYEQRGRQTTSTAAIQDQLVDSFVNSRNRDTYTGGFPENDFLGTYENLARESIAGENAPASGIKSGGISSAIQDLNQMRNRLLNEMLQRFSKNSVYGGEAGSYTMSVMSYSEFEYTAFSANGRALTEDGRVIDFNIELEMSRSYMEFMDVQVPMVNNALMDPLMVNVDSGFANISDQKFKFDLDADGTEETISMLGRGTGFLALDKNGDGIINDGNELFGTKSGDGFADLREYDSDGNGWIDENDEVFDKLRVWYKNEDGEDVLMDLKQADIGAIYLGEQKTDFSMYGMTGALNGMVRSTGFFLKESGGAGTVQHVDLATNAGAGNHMQIKEVPAFMVETEEAPEYSYIDNSTANSFPAGSFESEKDEKAEKADSPSKRSEIRKAAEERRRKIQERKRELSERLEKQRLERKEQYEKMMKDIREEKIENAHKAADEIADEILEESMEEEAVEIISE